MSSPAEKDALAAQSFTRSTHPEMILLGDHTRSCITWTLDKETERLNDMLDPAVKQAILDNGWTVRALALGHIFGALVAMTDFDDEKGRT